MIKDIIDKLRIDLKLPPLVALLLSCMHVQQQFNRYLKYSSEPARLVVAGTYMNFPHPRRAGLTIGICGHLCMFLTMFLTANNETVSSRSTSEAACSARWVVYPDTTVDGTRTSYAATTQQQCLDACVSDSDCVAVEWSLYGCWKDDGSHQRQQHPGVTTFQLARRCNKTSVM